MKKESNFRYVMRITLVLLTISIVVAAALALVNDLTAPIIEKENERKTQAAIEAVLPGGGEAISEFSDATGLVTKVFKGVNGYAVEVAPIGFDSAITMMVGVDMEGKVIGISIISHSESAGLGAIAAANNSAGQDFRNQFVGLSGNVAVGENIDAITNATITSNAVCEGVNAALDCVAALTGGAS